MKKHSNLSIFVPHMGCLHRCSFCDQRTISQTQTPPNAAEVTALCDEFLPENGQGVEIAFFGGSFTAIENSTRLELLKAAYQFVENGRAEGIRASTRPDAITPDIIAQMQEYRVKAIELGVQSMNEKVLALNGRKYSTKQVELSARLIKNGGISLGLQVMPGLYGADKAVTSENGDAGYEAEAIETMRSLLKLKPDTMRIYPTVVIKNTKLASLYLNEQYSPLTLEQAVKISTKLILMCEEAGVKIIRVGLAADAQLEKSVLSGPYHPAFRELCENEIYKYIIDEKLRAAPKGEYDIYVPKGALSAAKGQKKRNELFFSEKGYRLSFKENDCLTKREIILQARK